METILKQKVSKYPPDHGKRLSAGKEKARRHRAYLALGCPIPPPSQKEVIVKHLKASIDKYEITTHNLKQLYHGRTS